MDEGLLVGMAMAAFFCALVWISWRVFGRAYFSGWPLPLALLFTFAIMWFALPLWAVHWLIKRYIEPKAYR